MNENDWMDDTIWENDMDEGSLWEEAFMQGVREAEEEGFGEA
jgi:hypothetical protein|tara:strand:- start:65 stop:190 length:126 start_codon:yes stop_codon:yes gene_type:complete